MDPPDGPSLQTPIYNVNKCSCTRLLFLTCNHAQLLKSNTCGFSVHSPSPENLLVWETQTCAEVHKAIDFVLPICTALEDSTSASKVDFDMVSFDCEYVDLPIATTKLCGESECVPMISESNRVRFLLPHSSDVAWAPKKSALVEDGAGEDHYEDVTQQFNKTRRQLSKVSEDHRKKLLSIDLKIYYATKQDGKCQEPCLRRHDHVCEYALKAQKRDLVKMGFGTKAILIAKLDGLRVQREAAANRVLIASAG